LENKGVLNMKFVKIVGIVLALLASVSACSQLSPTEIPTASPTNQVTEVASPLPVNIPVTGLSTEPPIQHTVQPIDFPAERSNQATDYDSSLNANKKITTQDRFTFGRFERPFSTNMDVYFPQLDIIDTSVFQDEMWIYGKITVKGNDSSNALTGKYALELDLDRDGKGDWLVIASNPASTEWSVNGVQIYQDANKDVGNQSPMHTDGNMMGDGFETLVFDQGVGGDPDSAWVRILPDDPNTIEITIKRSVLGDPNEYLINMWAGSSLLNPALFDINDHFTHEQAGEADPEFKNFFPIKEVVELDNSCQMAVGFQPTGSEPGLCKTRVIIESPAGAAAPAQPQMPPPSTNNNNNNR
jgi:hypothetical protein